jgi:hypothetical protein
MRLRDRQNFDSIDIAMHDFHAWIVWKVDVEMGRCTPTYNTYHLHGSTFHFFKSFLPGRWKGLRMLSM